MGKVRLKYEPLPTQAEVFYDDETETMLHAAGLGCLGGESIVTTSQGPKKIEEIRWPFFVLSHDKNEPVWALSTAPYCKGIDTLLQVETSQGVFAAHELHRSFLTNGKCRYVKDLAQDFYLGDEASLLLSIEEPCQKAPFLNAQSYSSTTQDSRGGYLSYIRFYGEQLQSALVFAVSASPLLDGVLASFRGCDHGEISIQETMQRALEHIHQDRLLSHRDNWDYIHLLVVLEAALEYQGSFAKHLGHISCLPQLSRQFLETLKLHLKELGSLTGSGQISLTSCSVTSVERESLPRPYYDCHVFFTNSYYASGSFHHNSGKSYNLCMKLLRLSQQNKGFAGGLLVPDYPSFKKDIMPTFEAIFHANKLKKGKKWEYHQTDKRFNFSWNSEPIFVFSAEKEIAGPNLGYGGINEFSLCPWDRINEFIRRIRMNSPVRQTIMAGTPEDKHGWLQDFVDMMNAQRNMDERKFKICFGDTTENTHISKDYANKLEYLLDERALKVFKQGHIIKITGDLFYYSFDRTKHVSKDVEFISGQKVYANLDFNVGRMTCTFAHKINKEQDAFFDEFELLGNSDTRQAGMEIMNRFGNSNILLTIDSSGKNRKTTGASDYQILLELGFSKDQIRFKSQNPRLRERQLLVNGRFSKNLIRISPKCRVLIKDLEQVEQNKITFEKIKDKDGKLTHASDTLDYYIDYEHTLYLGRETQTHQL